MNSEHDRRLRRELLASRAMRSKSKACVTRRGTFTANGDRIQANGKAGVCYVVRVVGLNKAGRKALRHLFTRNGLAFVPCEFNRLDIAGGSVKRLKDDTCASAYMVWGNRRGFRPVFCHKYVTGIEHPGCTGNRLTTTLGRKPTIRPGKKTIPADVYNKNRLPASKLVG